MISVKLQVLMLLAVVVYFLLLWWLLRKRSLNLKYTLLWIFSGIVMMILSVFPNTLSWISHQLDIVAPTNALFAIMFFCVIIILMSLTAIVSKLNKKCTRLIQNAAILEERLRKLEVKNNKNEEVEESK